MSDPLVTVLLPTHSRYKSGLMPKSVESVLAQRYGNFEFFVIDDASSDGSEEYLRKIAAADSRVVHLRHDKNVGLPAMTIAQAYLQSRGQYIAFVFDDTELLPHHLELLVTEFKRRPEAAMIYGGVSIEPPGTAPVLLGGEFDMKRMLVDNYIGNSGVMMTREAIEAVGLYDPHVLVKRTCDWDLWMRLGRRNMPVYYCNQVVAVEKGATQADSLGMSVSRYDALTRKYQQTDRQDRLHPQQIAAGEALMFGPDPWMDANERNDLNVLVFEHLIRTRDMERAVEVSKQWIELGAGSPPAAKEPVTSTHATVADGDILIAAFNKYIAETRYACKNTCTSAFKLNDLTNEYDQLAEKYGHLVDIQDKHQELSDNYKALHTQYHSLLRSLSWKVTKPLRELTGLLKR
jgi:glycosyltransferase involved in cell wall biosynthesis